MKKIVILGKYWENLCQLLQNFAHRLKEEPEKRHGYRELLELIIRNKVIMQLAGNLMKYLRGTFGFRV